MGLVSQPSVVSTIDERLAEIGAIDVSHGAKMKLLSCIADLRLRETVLQRILLDAWSGELNLLSALHYLQEVVHTPLPSHQGSPISVVIINTIFQVLEYIHRHDPPGWMKPRVYGLLRDIYRRSVLWSTYVQLSRHDLQLVLDDSIMSAEDCSDRSGNAATAGSQSCGSTFRPRMPTEDSGFSESAGYFYSSSTDKELIWPQGENSASVSHSMQSYPPLASASLQSSSRSSLHQDIQWIQRAFESLELRRPLPSSAPAQLYVADQQRRQRIAQDAHDVSINYASSFNPDLYQLM